MRLRTDTPFADVEAFHIHAQSENRCLFFAHLMMNSDAKKAAEAKRRNTPPIMLCS